MLAGEVDQLPLMHDRRYCWSMVGVTAVPSLGGAAQRTVAVSPVRFTTEPGGVAKSGHPVAGKKIRNPRLVDVIWLFARTAAHRDAT